VKRILEPYGERIIVRQIKLDSIGMIVLPEQAKTKSIEGEIIAVGPDATEIFDVKVGDHVLFGRHAGFDLPSDAGGYKDCKLMNVEDLLAKIVEPALSEEPDADQMDSASVEVANA
jgi:chaperonin GroES